jgi:hypothetical protein
MTTTRLRDSWAELLSGEPQAGRDLRLLLVDSRADVRTFAAVAAEDGLPGLLVELPDSVRPSTFKPLVTRAFQLSAPALTGLPTGRWALVVQLTDRAFWDLFEALATDVLNVVRGASTGSEVAQATVRCVDRWRRFVERRGEPLSDEEVKGLIGELIVLCRCARRFGGDTALAAWTGPDRGVKDFELPNASVEVKTFQGDDAATVLISSPDQLDSVAERPVYLCAVRITPSDAQGATLGEIVQRATTVLGADPGTLGSFEDRLAASGYLASQAPLYVKRFVAGPLSMYRVTRGFPRIRSTDVPQGVLNVRFALKLNALAAWKTDPLLLIGDRVPGTEGPAQ